MDLFPIVMLQEGEEKRILDGHLWIFNNEIATISPGTRNGDIVHVLDFNGTPLGTGYINKKSKITVRLLDSAADNGFSGLVEDIYKLLKAKLTTAVKKRSHIKNTNAKRYVFSEADSLPGLIADMYGKILVIQITTLGMEKQKEKIVAILDELLKPSVIYEKSLSPSREKEGMEKKEAIIKPETAIIKPVEIYENGLKFIVDLVHGTKTGFYLDQRDNRDKLQKYCEGKKVLDAFCYTGGFSAFALKAGAMQTLGLDTNEEALKTAADNMRLNKFEKFTFEKANVFNKLRDLVDEEKKFGVVILDPPAFSKTKEEKEGAIKGYKDIHMYGMKLLEKGGHLMTFSCSQNISKEDMITIVNEAAQDARISIEFVETLTQATDHPYTSRIPETFYLKGLVLKRK